MYHETLNDALNSEGLLDAYTEQRLNIVLDYETSWRGGIGHKFVTLYRMPSGRYEIVAYTR